MKIKKGEVVFYISPSEWNRYKVAGWRRIQEPTREQIAKMNEKQRLKRLAKGGQ